jgi:cation/acetate symporter
MIFYALAGGMKGTTWVQIVKAVILTVGAVVTTIWVLARDGFRLSGLAPVCHVDSAYTTPPG